MTNLLLNSMLLKQPFFHSQARHYKRAFIKTVSELLNSNTYVQLCVGVNTLKLAYTGYDLNPVQTGKLNAARFLDTISEETFVGVHKLLSTRLKRHNIDTFLSGWIYNTGLSYLVGEYVLNGECCKLNECKYDRRRGAFFSVFDAGIADAIQLIGMIGLSPPKVGPNLIRE